MLAVAGAVAVGLGLVLPPAWHDLAAGRLQAVEALESGGDAAEAEVAFSVFVAAEEHRGTRALARAWLRRGQVGWSEGQVEPALDAMARAYVEASEPADIVASMRSIAEVHHARWQLAELAPALEVLAEHDTVVDPAAVRMRVDVALDRNDFGAALTALAAPAAPPELAAQRPLLAALAHARPLDLRTEQAVAVTTPNGPGFVLLSEVGTRVTLTDALLRPTATHTVPEGVLELVVGTPAYFAPEGGITTL